MQRQKSDGILSPEMIPEGKLRLDPRNPRLGGSSPDVSQEDLVEVLWREMAVEEIALSIAHNGYFDHEPLFAERNKDDTYTVIEGNRRVAAVKILLHPEVRRRVGATDLPQLSASARDKLKNLPVYVTTRQSVWQYVGFKHVNGPQAWESYSKAQYIAWVHNELRIPLKEIARRIGDQHDTVARLYRALMAIEQAEEAGVFRRSDRSKKHFSFSHLYTGMDYPGIQKFVGISRSDPDTRPSQRPVPKARLKNLGELCVWLYGSKSHSKEPVIRSQNPDLRILDQVLQSKDGTAALRRGLPLTISRNIGRGDSALFREALVSAKQSLEEARAKLVTGYKGERDLRQIAVDAREIAQTICDDMDRPRRRPRP
jgi:hypothetical protein